MDLGIEGRVALVCGGSRGIGRAICDELLVAGCHVLSVGRDEQRLHQVVEHMKERGGSVAGLCADLLDLETYRLAVHEAVRAFGVPEIAIFNGLSPKSGAFDALCEQDFTDAHHALVNCFARMVREVAPGMKRAAWGRILTIGSNVAKQPFRGGRDVHYALANTERIAAVGLSKTLSAEMAPFGITVNTILTGAIATESARDWCRTQASEAGLEETAFLQQFITARIPVGRMGTPKEIASLTAFLCSALAGYTTGETVLCDGGVSQAMI